MLSTMRPEAQKFKRPQRTPPPPASVASTCTRCCGEIDEDDEFLVDLCTVCDTLRHRELAAAKRESAEKGWCGGGSPQPPPCEPRLPVSPDSVMAGLQAMRVGRGVFPPATEPSDGPAADESDEEPVDQESLKLFEDVLGEMLWRPMGATARAAAGWARAAAYADDDTPSQPRAPAPSPAICSETNRQAAEEWLARARCSYDAGDDAAALRHCEKSLRLHAESSNAGAAALTEELRKFGAGSAAAEAAARVLRATGHHVRAP